MVFLLYSVNVVNYIDGFINVTPTLFFYGKYPLVKIQCPFYILLGLIC